MACICIALYPTFSHPHWWWLFLMDIFFKSCYFWLSHYLVFVSFDQMFKTAYDIFKSDVLPPDCKESERKRQRELNSRHKSGSELITMVLHHTNVLFRVFHLFLWHWCFAKSAAHLMHSPLEWKTSNYFLTFMSGDVMATIHSITMQGGFFSFNISKMCK